MKYLKAFLIVISTTILVNIFLSSLCYFDIIRNTTNSVLKLLSILIFSFISGIYIGIKSNNKGYLEGIKVNKTLNPSSSITSLRYFLPSLA